MKERLIQLMQMLGMNPTQFATAIGIQRATLQHILSGRNETSLKIVMQICKTFPQVNIEWLVFGKGPATNSSLPQNEGQRSLIDPNDETLIFSMEEMGALKNQNLNEVANPVQQTTAQAAAQQQTAFQSATQQTTSCVSPATVSTVQSMGREEKRPNIKEVFIFLDDGTYEKLTPSR
ncbi:MAG: helix-turn-helix domain-containing protein [Bacteroidaceae bacterium]|nr:helix-turn-helix domain-containing protein [Bacteroidaceae bacterium]